MLGPPELMVHKETRGILVIVEQMEILEEKVTLVIPELME